MLCSYGCNKEAIKTFKTGNHCCSEFSGQCSELRKKNSNAIKAAHKRGIRFGTDIKIECKFCGIEISKNSIKKHEDGCIKNHIHLNYCPVCGKVSAGTETDSGTSVTSLEAITSLVAAGSDEKGRFIIVHPSRSSSLR